MAPRKQGGDVRDQVIKLDRGGVRVYPFHMSDPPHLNEGEVLERLRKCATPGAAYAMYSSLLEGIVTDPALMTLPAEDHLVHRGDGVFETLKAIGGRLYNAGAHWRRLADSARAMRLDLSWTADTLERLAGEVLQSGGQPDALLRVLVSRGPGGFGVHPHCAKSPALYILAYPCPVPLMERKPGGASAITCRIPLKPPLFAAAKTCNYLPNALMADEAHRAGADFALGVDDEDGLAEGSTESAALVLEPGILTLSASPRLLPGTTLERVCTLATARVLHPPLAITRATVPAEDLRNAHEILMMGTSIDVCAVTTLDGQPVGDGQPGPVFRQLAGLLREDLRANG